MKDKLHILTGILAIIIILTIPLYIIGYGIAGLIIWTALIWTSGIYLLIFIWITKLNNKEKQELANESFIRWLGFSFMLPIHLILRAVIRLFNSKINFTK